MKVILPNPLYLISLLFCSLFTCAQAADNDRFLMQDSEGFITSLPNISDITVTQHLMELQQDLETELTALKQEVKRNSFKAIDTLVTVIMPGGLLYAKLRLDSFKHSEQQLNRVNDELTLISGELITFRADNGDLLIATSME
jgi:hypothetical protein